MMMEYMASLLGLHALSALISVLGDYGNLRGIARPREGMRHCPPLFVEGGGMSQVQVVSAFSTLRAARHVLVSRWQYTWQFSPARGGSERYLEPREEKEALTSCCSWEEMEVGCKRKA